MNDTQLGCTVIVVVTAVLWAFIAFLVWVGCTIVSSLVGALL